MRHAILQRDGWRCQYPGCRGRAHLEAHHIHYDGHRGCDHAHNLVTLCHAHHALIHDGHVRLRGRAPDGLVWEMGLQRRGLAGVPLVQVEGQMRTDPAAAPGLLGMRSLSSPVDLPLALCA